MNKYSCFEYWINAVVFFFFFLNRMAIDLRLKTIIICIYFKIQFVVSRTRNALICKRFILRLKITIKNSIIRCILCVPYKHQHVIQQLLLFFFSFVLETSKYLMISSTYQSNVNRCFATVLPSWEETKKKK